MRPSTESSGTDTTPPDSPPKRRTILGAVEARIISGLLVVLPAVITVWIVFMLYKTFRSYVIDPIVQGIMYLRGSRVTARMPEWWADYMAPLIALVLVLILLYLLGLFVRSRMYRWVDAMFLHVPVVKPIYQAVQNLFEALEQQRKSPQFKRVVLVEFPQPGMRSLGLVTNTLKDQTTGRNILCVVVLTGVVPPAGFTLFVPEESVTDIDWSMNDALQSIVTGGLTAPGTIGYERVEGLAAADGPPSKDSPAGIKTTEAG